jgi:hypothetical protein
MLQSLKMVQYVTGRWVDGCGVVENCWGWEDRGECTCLCLCQGKVTCRSARTEYQDRQVYMNTSSSQTQRLQRRANRIDVGKSCQASLRPRHIGNVRKSQLGSLGPTRHPQLMR